MRAKGGSLPTEERRIGNGICVDRPSGLKRRPGWTRWTSSLLEFGCGQPSRPSRTSIPYWNTHSWDDVHEAGLLVDGFAWSNLQGVRWQWLPRAAHGWHVRAASRPLST